MSWLRALSRARALRLAAFAAAGTLLCALLVGALARIAAPLEGAGPTAAVLSILVLLLSVATLIGILVLMYALYAAIRGPMADSDS